MELLHRLPSVLVLLAVAGTVALGGPRQLTVDDCVRLGLENSPALRASRAGVDVADARRQEAVAARLPSLSLNAGYTRLSSVAPFVLSVPGTPIAETLSASPSNSYQARLSLQQPLFTGGRLRSADAMAAANAGAARSDYARDRAQLVYDITSNYWRLFQAMQSRAVIDSDIGRIRAHLADVRNLETQGLATHNDVLKVQVLLANAQLVKVDVSNGAQLAMTAMNNLVGLPLSTEIEPTSSPTVQTGKSEDSDSLPELIDLALKNRPEVRSMGHRVRVGAAGVSLARAARYPQVMATGDYTYARPNSRAFPSKDKFSSSWGAGVALSFDVWNWGTAAHKTAEAEAQLRQAEATLVQVRNSVALGVTQDFLSLHHMRAKVDAAEAALAQAEESRRVADVGFKAGAVLNSDLLDAEMNLMQAQLNLIQAQADLVVSQAKMEQGTGRSRQ